MSIDERLLKYDKFILDKMPKKVSYDNIPPNLKRYFITENNKISISSFTKIKSIDNNIEVKSLATPLLAAMIEEGFFNKAYIHKRT